LPSEFDFNATKNTNVIAKALDFENSLYAPSDRRDIVDQVIKIKKARDPIRAAVSSSRQNPVATT
jgi:hypothetical protein